MFTSTTLGRTRWNIPSWKRNNLVSLRPNYFIFIGYLKTGGEERGSSESGTATELLFCRKERTFGLFAHLTFSPSQRGFNILWPLIITCGDLGICLEDSLILFTFMGHSLCGSSRERRETALFLLSMCERGRHFVTFTWPAYGRVIMQ